MTVREVREAYARAYCPDTFMRFYKELGAEFHLFANPSRHIPVSPVPLLLDRSYEALFTELVDLFWQVLADHGYRRLCAQSVPEPLAGPGAKACRAIDFDPACNIGCIDLHLDKTGLQVIEFMVLPPGMSGIYPGLIHRYGRYLEDCVPGCGAHAFAPGWDRGRCEEALADNAACGNGVERVAVIDWDPAAQVTYGEFQYTLEQLRQARGIDGVIAEPREVEDDGSAVRVKGLAVDRILNRLTLIEWTEHHREIPAYTRLLWERPDCFVYHPYLWYLGDKNSLVLLSDRETRAALSVPPETRRMLEKQVPVTRRLTEFLLPGGKGWDVDRLSGTFGGPSRMVIKPISSHASKGIFYGPADMPSRKKLGEVLSGIRPEEFVAMQLVPPPEMPVPRGGGETELWKYDLRVFVINGHYVFPGGRIYLGDYTNQVPCRAFAPLFFV